jgi:hypothetical protein
MDHEDRAACEQQRSVYPKRYTYLSLAALRAYTCEKFIAEP